MSGGRAGHVARPTGRPKGETPADAVSGAGTEGERRAPRRRFLRTEDGVLIDAAYDPGERAAEAEGAGLVLVVAHGFTGDLERPHVRRVAAALRRRGAVVTFSFRGHGASGGHSTVGDREVLDLAAAVEWARGFGHGCVATVGFSMGGSVVLRHAALHGPGGPGREGRTEASTDAVVSVSAPARWYYRGTAPMRKLHWLVTRPEGRLVGRYGFHTRIHHREWDPVPLSPVEAVPQIAPTPLLIVHGDRDGYFPLDHPRMLAAAAGEQGELWIEGGMGHAEHAATDELLARIGRWAFARAG